MKLIVSSSELLKATLTALKAIPSKATDTIFENFLFELEAKTLKITATDKELTLYYSIEVDKAIEEGRIGVPAKQITDLLKELPDQPISIETKTENSFECSWTNGHSILPYFNADDFPKIQELSEEKHSFSISMPELLEAINSTIYACANDESRVVMNAIFFDIIKGSSTLVASDMNKLICYTTELNSDFEDSFILHKRHANLLKSILGKEDDMVLVEFDNKAIVFKFQNISIICCRVLGSYPDYKAIIPKDNNNVLQIGRSKLLNIVKRIAVCSPKASSHIKFELKDSSLEVSAQDTGFELEASEKTPCEYSGEELTIGFRSNHIVDILSNLNSEEVIMKFADRRRAALILPVPDSKEADKSFGIVMPVMVK